MDHANFGLLVIRLCLGLFMAYHGYNKVFGKGGLAGTAGWFGSMGWKYPAVQAKVAAATEIGAGLMVAAGFLTPLACAGLIGLMVVAIVTVHWKVGFFIFLPNGGWEYCGAIALCALGLASIGAGEWSLDHAMDLDVTDWKGLAIALVVGVGGALLQLGLFFKPAKTSS